MILNCQIIWISDSVHKVDVRAWNGTVTSWVSDIFFRLQNSMSAQLQTQSGWTSNGSKCLTLVKICQFQNKLVSINVLWCYIWTSLNISSCIRLFVLFIHFISSELTVSYESHLSSFLCCLFYVCCLLLVSAIS